MKRVWDEIINRSLATLLQEARDELEDWNEIERSAARILGFPNVFLGGDLINPFIVLPNRSILRSNSATDFTNWKEDISQLAPLVPNRRVLLIGLGKPEKYQATRLPLGIARLGQYLRYFGSARVDLVDQTLDKNSKTDILDLLKVNTYDFIGISVNFGQWDRLSELLELLPEGVSTPIVLGNILAAMSPAEAFSLIGPGRQGYVSLGYGEEGLRLLCQSEEVPGSQELARAGMISSTSEVIQIAQNPTPKALVFPDNRITRKTLDAGGQFLIESSWGCHYSKCTFCPRSHRGRDWTLSASSEVVDVISLAARYTQNRCNSQLFVSFVDEEFFGTEIIPIAPSSDKPQSSKKLDAICVSGAKSEIYTRPEQLFSKRRSLNENLYRLNVLRENTQYLQRVFIGVESGVSTQLKRYGKGLSVGEIISSIRAASGIGINLEFGFITFDPLLTLDELNISLKFLERRDIYLHRVVEPHENIDAFISSCMNDEWDASLTGDELFFNVAYLATELEVLRDSAYIRVLKRYGIDARDYPYDPEFCRYQVPYADEAVGWIAGWARVWTEGMFVPVYKARMQARVDGSSGARSIVQSARAQTFYLLKWLVRGVQSKAVITTPEVMSYMQEASAKVLGAGGTDEMFNENLRSKRRSA